jgi:hypothetical protein
VGGVVKSAFLVCEKKGQKGGFGPIQQDFWVRAGNPPKVIS